MSFDLDEQQISSVSLGFDNEVIKVTHDYNCLLLKEIFERGFDGNDNEVKIQQDSFIFKTYILQNKNFEDEKKLDFENLFQVLGYFGATEKLKELTIEYKRYYAEEYYNRESVRKLFQERLDEKDDKDFIGNWESNGNVDGPMIEKYKTKNWELIVDNENLDLDFIKKHIDEMNFVCKIFKSRYIDFNFIKNFNLSSFEWDEICSNPNIKENVFDKIISYCIENCPNKIPWYTLVKNPVISEKFIRKYILDEDYEFENILYIPITICFRNPNIGEKFIEDILENYENIELNDSEWELLAMFNSNISEEFYIKYEDKLPSYTNILFWRNLCINKRISCQFIEDRIDDLYIEDEDFWVYIASKPNLDECFISKYIEYFNLYLLFQNSNIKEEIIELYMDIEDENQWAVICSNKGVSESFFKKYINYIDWNTISTNTGLNERFFEEHKNKVNWKLLFNNRFRLDDIIDYKKAPLYKYMFKY